MSDRRRMPSQVSGDLSRFDQLAGWVARFTSRAAFFAMCVALVVIWAPSILLLRDVDTWQLVINTATTIVTFLMVALIQNTQHRADQALQTKLNAIAAALADIMLAVDPDDVASRRELRAAVGLEDREGS